MEVALIVIVICGVFGALYFLNFNRKWGCAFDREILDISRRREFTIKDGDVYDGECGYYVYSEKTGDWICLDKSPRSEELGFSTQSKSVFEDGERELRRIKQRRSRRKSGKNV